MAPKSIFSRVLLPVELSIQDGRSIEALGNLNLPPGSEVTLLHVVEPLQDTPFDQLPEFYKELEEQALEKMMVLVGQLSELGINCKRDIVYGDRVGAILQFLRDNETTLLVLRSHAVDLQAPERVGSISHRVSLCANCAVLLVR